MFLYEILGLFSFILRETVSFGSRLCVFVSVKLIITFKCIIEHEFDRLQLSFNTGIIFLFACV